MLLQDATDPELRRMIRRKNQAAVIPVGAIEQHGPHLPVSVDSDIVTEVARRICNEGKFLLLPTLSYGVSFEHAPFFNLSLQKSSLRRVLADIIDSLASNKIGTVFVINGHHGNQESLRAIKSKKARVHVLSYWHYMQDPFDHAGLVETSLMLAISKNVKMSRARRGFVEPIMSRAQRARLSKRASKSFVSVAKNGIWGDPRGASAKKGRQLLAEIAQNMGKKCQTCLTGNGPKLHQ